MNTETYDMGNQDLQEYQAHTGTSNTMESENVSNEGFDRSNERGAKGASAPSFSPEEVMQIQQRNHEQFNLIKKLQKD